LLLEVARPLMAARDLPEAAEELVERIVLRQVRQLRSLHRLRDVDADHGGALLLVELGEIGQSPARLGCRRRGEEYGAQERAHERQYANFHAAFPG